MYCPQCGSKNSIEQKFCRRCGIALAAIAEVFRQQPAAGELAEINRQERLVERFGQIAFGGFGIVIVVGIAALIYRILTQMVLSGDSFWTGILLASFILFAGLTLSYVFLRESVSGKKKKVDVRFAGDALSGPPAAQQLPDYSFEPAVSVVENTTDLLPVESRTKKLQ